jgi:hypothetical protein
MAFITIPWTPIVTGLYLLVQSGGAVPTIDVASTCRAAERTLMAMNIDAAAANFEGCMKQQMAARNSLVQQWSTFPAADRSRCVITARYMPSYVEWLTCLENAQAVRNIGRQSMLHRSEFVD